MTENRRTEDPRIRQPVERGAKNRPTLGLLQNRCAHVRVEKTGGVNVIERMIGDPIGRHFVVCQYAAPAGWASWDLSGSALQFHDTNGVGCSHSKSVGFPNLAELVAERDAAVRRTDLKEKLIGQTAEAARAARQVERTTLRRSLDPVQATLVDQLEALDNGRGELE